MGVLVEAYIRYNIIVEINWENWTAVVDFYLEITLFVGQQRTDCIELIQLLDGHYT